MESYSLNMIHTCSGVCNMCTLDLTCVQCSSAMSQGHYVGAKCHVLSSNKVIL